MQEMARAIMVQAQTMSANVPVEDVGHRQNIRGQEDDLSEGFQWL